MKVFYRLCNAVAFFVLMSVVAIAREPALATLVPANAIASVITPNLTQFDRQWSGTGFARLWQCDAFADFRKSFQEAARLTAESDLSLFGINWQQLLSITSGEACWSLVPLGDDVGFLLLVDVSAHVDEAAELVAKLQHQTTSRSYFIENGVLVITNRAELAQTPSEALASSEPFAAIMQRTHSMSAQLSWYLDPWAFLSLISRSGYEGLAKSWLQLSDNGFKVVQSAGGAMIFTTDNQDIEHRWLIYAPGESKKAARLLDFATIQEEKLAEWIPADVDSVASTQWNLGGALLGYGSYFDSTYAEDVEGTFDAVLEDINQEPTGPQVDIAALMKLQAGPVFSLSKTLPDGQTAVVYAVKVSAGEKMAHALVRMFGPDEGVELKSVGNFKMWVFKDTASAPDSGPIMGPDLADYALSVAQDYFYFATSEAALTGLLEDNTTTKLIHTDSYGQLESQLKEHRPDNAIGWRISPTAAGIRPAYEGFRTGGTIDLGKLLGDHEDAQHRLDLSKLPAGGILPKFIAAGFGFVSQTEVGWLLQGYVEKRVR